MLFNPIIAILKNTKDDFYHPIVFVENPLPGPPSDNKPIRHKSKMHHTTGFDTREAALVSANKIADDENMKRCFDGDIEWDGEGIPALVHFFSEEGDKILL